MKTKIITSLKKELLVIELPRVCDYELTKEGIFVKEHGSHLFLQVENNGWIKIESESIIPNGDYWMIENEENEIMAVFDVDEDTNQDSIRKYYSHYQPIIKPEPPKF